MSSLTLPFPINRTWGVTWDSGANNHTSDDTGVHVKYVKGEYASPAGTNFRLQPEGMFPCSSLTLHYKVFFPENFDFVKGGKLPGMWGGESGAGGGNWSDDGWSFRVMFRAGGTAVAYVYMATDQGKYDGDENCKLVKNQGNGFEDIAHHTKGSGIDLWRNDGLKLRAGEWNSVELKATINTPGKADGVVQLTVNGKTKAFSKIQWFEREKKINGMLFSTWFGGGSKDYAPKKTQRATFKNIVLTKST